MSISTTSGFVSTTSRTPASPSVAVPTTEVEQRLKQCAQLIEDDRVVVDEYDADRDHLLIVLPRGALGPGLLMLQRALAMDHSSTAVAIRTERVARSPLQHGKVADCRWVSRSATIVTPTTAIKGGHR
jgi:hypothetical protein